MNKDAAFMKAINDLITAVEGIQNTLGTVIERVIKLEEKMEEQANAKVKTSTEEDEG